MSSTSPDASYVATPIDKQARRRESLKQQAEKALENTVKERPEPRSYNVEWQRTYHKAYYEKNRERLSQRQRELRQAKKQVDRPIVENQNFIE